MIVRFVRIFTSAVVLILLAAPLFGSFCVPGSKPPQSPPSDPPPPVCEPKSCDKCSKSPCYVATGTYVNDFVDLQIPTAGMYPLTVSRRYDSSRPADGPLGVGWSSSLTAHLYYATYLVTAPSTYSYEADIVMPDGVIYRFTTSGGSGFTPPFGRYDTLVKNGDGTYSLTLQHTRSVYRFSADGSLASLTDDFGNAITYTNDASGRIQRIADGAGSGRYVDVTWGADGRIASLTDNSGRVLKYFYENGNGTLSSFSDPLVASDSASRSTYYTYISGRFGAVLSRIADRWHRVISDLDWFPNGKLKSYTDGAYSGPTSAGEKYSYDYHPEGLQPYTAKTDSFGTSQYPYGDSGLVYPTNYANGQVLADTSGTGYQSQFNYDSMGRVTTVTRASPEPSSSGDGTVVWYYAYDSTWPEQVISVTPKNLSSQLKTNWAGWVYDYYGASAPAPGALWRVWRVRSDTVTKDLVATYEYNSHGRLSQQIDDNGLITYYGYNAAGDLTSIAGASRSYQYTYDSLGRILSVVDPNGQTTTNVYDALDRLTSTKLPKPSPTVTYDTVTTYSYDNYDPSSGLSFTNTTDPNGRVTKIGTDALGHAIQTVDAAGNIIQFTYQHDLLQKIRDANGNETSYGYTTSRELMSITYPDGATETYNTAGGTLHSRTDRLGNRAEYYYDPIGRIASIQYPGYNYFGGRLGLFYSYDGQKLTGLEDDQTTSVAVHTYSYDSSWRLTVDLNTITREKKTYTYGPGTGSLLSSYTIEPPTGSNALAQTVSYGYLPTGQVGSETWSLLPGAFTFDYTPSGRYSSMTFPNGQQRRFTYDNQDRLTNITNTSPSGGTLASFDYGYDYDWQALGYSMLGQRTSVSVNAPGLANIVAGLTKYSYDDNYQLVRVDYPNNSYDGWTYDAIGNRVGRHHPIYGWVVPYTYFTNASGANTQRLKNDGYYDFSYDAAGNVKGATTPYSVDTYTWDYAGRLTSYAGKTYTYDSLGRASTSSNGSTTKYAIVNDHTVSERNTTTGVATDYVFGPGVDEPLAKRTANGGVFYFGVDGLGSVVLTTDAIGTTSSSTGYSPWGEPATLPAELFGYTGRETGGPSWYYRARYYDSTHGRFVSEDPIGLPLDVNQYRYVFNNPLAYVDPFGEQAQQVLTVGAGAVLTAVIGLQVYGYMRSHPELYDIFRPPPPFPLPVPLPPPGAATGPRDRPVQPGRDEPRPGERYQYPPNACPIPATGPVAPAPRGPCDYPNGQLWRWAASAPTQTQRLLRAVLVAYWCHKERS